MADDVLAPEGHPSAEISANSVTDSRRLTEARFKNWVFDPELNFGETNARDIILKAATKDLTRSEKGERFDGDQILERINPITSKLEDRMETTGSNYLSFERPDKQSDEIVVTEVRKDESIGWVAVERRKSDGSIIAQARISPSGATDLTLQYLEDRYSDRNANPDITADSRFQETTAVTFELLAKNVLKNHLEGWVAQSAIDGSDIHGRMVYDAYRASLFDPTQGAGDAAVSYQKALISKENLDKPGELNKLLSSLDSLHRQIGDDGYKPEIDVSGQLEEVTDESERQRIKNEAITKAALEDLQDFPDRYAAKKIESYAGAKARVLEKEEDLRREISKDKVERSGIRSASYRLAAEKKKLARVVLKDAIQAGNESVGVIIGSELEQRPAFSEKKLEEITDENKGKLIEAAKESYIQELFAKGDFKYGNVLADRFDQDETNQAFGTVAELDNQIAGKRENLLLAINTDPDTLCNIASEIRQLQIQKRTEIANVRIKIAEKATETVEGRWKKAREEMGLKIMKFGLGGARDLRSQFVSAGREWLASRGDVFNEEFRRNVEPVIGQLSEFASEKAEDTVEILHALDQAFLGGMRENGHSTFEAIEDTAKIVKAKYLRISNDLERAKIVVDKRARTARYETELWIKEKQTEIFIRTRAWKWEAQLKVGETIGGEAVKEQAKDRAEQIKRVTSADFQGRVARIRSKENPHLAVFQQDLERRVKLIEKVQKEADFNEIELPPASNEAVSAKETENPNLKEMTEDEFFESISEDKTKIDNEMDHKPEVLDGKDDGFNQSILEFQGKLAAARGKVDTILDPEGNYSGIKDYEQYIHYQEELDMLMNALPQYVDNKAILVALLGEYSDKLQLTRKLAQKIKSQIK